MSRPHPKLAVTDKEAAHMLSLPLGEFNKLVKAGALPRPILLASKHPRWPVKTLDAVLSSAALDDDNEFET